MHLRTYYPTVVLSDIHLGTSHSKTIEVSNFLKSVSCDRLILNGDIIDGWHLRKAGTKRWQAKHTDFFKVIMKMMELTDQDCIRIGEVLLVGVLHQNIWMEMVGSQILLIQEVVLHIIICHHILRAICGKELNKVWFISY